MRTSTYDKFPSIPAEGVADCGWEAICRRLKERITGRKAVFVVELYPGTVREEITDGLLPLETELILDSWQSFRAEKEILELTREYVTDDPLFGFMCPLEMEALLDPASIAASRKQIEGIAGGLVLVIGPGASLIAPDPDLLVYADMARWEIQGRMKSGEVHGLGVDNHSMPFSHQYKRGYFADWRISDRLKRRLFPSIDFFLDTNDRRHPKLVAAPGLYRALEKLSHRPFRVAPYFDPGPWGGQWMRDVCGLDPEPPNFAWCFDCVPEENSLLLDFSGTIIEIPAIDLVFLQPSNLLGEAVEARFGAEFPIRFDFLDTMDGGNLSLQVHPDTRYIRETFGMDYTQDESYYLLDAKEDATVFLGLKSGIDPKEMIAALETAQAGGNPFEAEWFINRFPAKKHDHFLIPAGTVHCSGANAMVLEISATPYIFTFKMWDWGRMGLDGKPRPINIGHAEKVIRWERDTGYAMRELVGRMETIEEGDGWREERTGLHEAEFIETRRHWFSVPVRHQTNGSVNVLNLAEGEEAVVESPSGLFEPFTVHYAETFIVPDAVKEYVIRPTGASEGKEIATIKAYVRI